MTDPETPPEQMPSAEQVREAGEEGDVLEYAREDALDFLEGLLEAMELDGQVTVELQDEEVTASVVGEDLGILIGRHGMTLDAIQELLRAAVQHQARERVRVALDIEGYRKRRIEAVGEDALQVAHRVVDEGGEVELDPMPAFERKVVHEIVAGIEGVTSFSEGDEPHRRVVIRSEEEAAP